MAVESEHLQQLRATARVRPKDFFYAGREDSPFKRLVIHTILIFAVIVAVYPVLRVFSISVRPGNRLLSTSLAIIPADATLQNYVALWQDRNFFLWLWNSLLVTVSVATIGVVLAATGAYAFSRWKFPGRRPALIFLLTTQMIPAGMLLIPIFILLVRLGLVNTYRGLIFAYSVSSVPFSIWILKGYYDTIPPDLEEAAKIDGASQMEAFWRIIMPLSTPALAIVFLFNFMSAWSEFIVARVIIKNQQLLTWPLGLYSLQGQFQTAWGQLAAASILIALPVLALFLYSSKWLISGLTIGSVKG
ncbi:MAG: sugar ABC transporter permease [Ardenticatenaceae bacterium]|nr:sugar ABC transporter permease [Ardenticatenaceae bacterium]HBY94014.1 ABC transporter [Chloroflexota bacterium]